MRSPTWGNCSAFGVVSILYSKRQLKGQRRNNMTLDLDNMTQAEFDDFMVDLKINDPNFFQFIVDFINKKVTVQEVEDFQKMEHEVQQIYIKNYKARE